MNDMSFLLRLELPNVPGSLGAVATALGGAGADIEAIEIVEHRDDGRAIDDVLLELPSTVMPDAMVSACQAIEGVRVHWISRYGAGANLHMDLEAVEVLTTTPRRAVERLAETVPATFRADWALTLVRDGAEVRVLASTRTAPAYIDTMHDWLDIERAARLPELAEWDSTVLAAAPIPERDAVIAFGRHGGPEVLDSELARLGHLAGLAASINASVG